MDCTFKKWGYGHYRGPFYCEKSVERVTQYRYNQYCQGPCYSECPIYKDNLEKNCFFTTIFSKLNDDTINSKEFLNNWQVFRKKVLEKDSKYRDLLVYHDRISPFIADAIRNTSISTTDEFLKIIYNNYLIAINNYIKNNQVEKTIEVYKKMLELLIVNFSLGQEYASMKYHYKHPELHKPKSLFRSIKGHNRSKGE